MFISKEAILKLTNEFAIYQYYFYAPIIPNKHNYLNPFRYDRRKGSCLFKLKNNRLLFIDYATNERIDCFAYVMKLYNLNFQQALCKINEDLNLNLPYPKVQTTNTLIPISKSSKTNYNEFLNYDEVDVHYRIYRKDWDDKSMAYWNKYGITLSTLEKYEVAYVDKYFAAYGKKNWIKRYDSKEQDDLCFVYQFTHKQKLKVKIYRPLAHISEKWKSNTSLDIIQGYKQLDSEGDLLIITSSLKDVMALHEAGIPAIAPQAESLFINEDKLRILKTRFKKIVICYDNDKTGITKSSQFSTEYNIPNIVLPKIGNCKDPSDLSAKYGIDMMRNIVLQKLTLCT